MGGDSGLKFPEPPVLAAGGIGGPFCMLTVTPARNALTYAANDASLSLGGVWRRVFASGFTGGWTGGVYPAIAACPQFLCLGPMYHVYESVSGAVGGIVLTGITETTVLYGAETKNAQLAINSKTAGRIPTARIQSPFNPLGPGAGINCTRNILAMSGMRVINEPIAAAIEKAAGGTKSGAITLASDLTANCCAACMTMPLHMLYQYVVTAGPELWDKPKADQVADWKRFLSSQYFPNGKLSSVIVRDAILRSVYIAGAYTMFVSIERSAIKHWPR